MRRRSAARARRAAGRTTCRGDRAAGGVVSAPPDAERLGSVAEIRAALWLLVLPPFSFTVELSAPQVCSQSRRESPPSVGWGAPGIT